jgi:uncharacterized membrane protein HdeD (DUF308 family)
MIDEPRNLTQASTEELQPMTKDWFWFLLLGIGLAVLGLGAISYAPFTTLVTIKVFAIILIAAGIVQAVTAFWAPKWSGLFVHLLLGIFYIVVGFLIADCPFDAAMGFALLMSVFFFVGGIFRIVASMQIQYAGWGWSLLSGIISLLLGIIIWTHWPASTVLIGLFVGIEILFNGFSWVMFALLLRSLKNQAAPA